MSDPRGGWWSRPRRAGAVVFLAVVSSYAVLRAPRYGLVIGDGVLFLGVLLLGLWRFRARMPRRAFGVFAGLVLTAWAVIMLLDFSEMAVLPVPRAELLRAALMAAVLGGSYWLATAHFGYLRARWSPGRGALIVSLATIFAMSAYGALRWRGVSGDISGYGWPFVGLAFVRALLRGPGGPAGERG